MRAALLSDNLGWGEIVVNNNVAAKLRMNEKGDLLAKIFIVGAQLSFIFPNYTEQDVPLLEFSSFNN